MTRHSETRFRTVASFALIAVVAVGVAGFALAGTAAGQTGSNFQVTIDSTNSPVTEGDTLQVQATVNNTGDTADTQTIALSAGGSQRDSAEVNLDPNENRTVTLEWTTSDGDAGDYTPTVSSDNDSASTDVRVNEPAFFDVNINSTNSPITENDTLRVEAVVRNTGDERGFQEISLEVGGKVRDNTSFAADPGAEVTRTLTWETEAGDNGSYTANVSSEDDSATRGVVVNDVSEFDVDIDATNEPVLEGETLRVNATVENTDSATDTQEIELVTDGQVRDTRELELGGGESETVNLTWATENDDAGDYTANVSSETDTASTDVTVNAPPTAAFARDPATPNVNEAVEFQADASDPDGSIESYEWQIDGETVSSSSSFSYTFSEAGEHDVTLTVTDDDGATATETRTIRVNAPPEVTITAGDATVGEAVTIVANASDDGTISTYEWSVDGEVVSTAESLTYTFEEAGTHQVTVRVTDDNGATTATTTSITVEGDGTEATPTATATDTATASPPSEDGAGFGVAVALVALVATALLARRHR